VKSPYWNVTIAGSSDATVNGVPVEMVVPTNVYSSVFQHLAAVARQAGRPVLARGVDETKGGRVAWFTVDANGQALAASPASVTPSNSQPPPPNGTPPRPRRAPAQPMVEEPEREAIEPPPARALMKPEPQASEPRQQVSPARARASEPQEATTSPVPPDAPPPSVPSAPPPRAATHKAPSRPVSPDVPLRSISMNVNVPAASPPAQLEPPPPSSLFVRPPKAVPQGGVRGAMYRLTAGRVNLGPSQTQVRLAERGARIARPLERPYSTVFLSFKGGIGKTSTTVGVGLILAQLRGAPPIAIDADPDAGDLAERLLGEDELMRAKPRCLTDLARDISKVRTWTDLTGYITQVDRLHVVAGEQDPKVSDSLTAEGYTRAHELVRHFFSVILTDCGTGVTQKAMRGILSRADSVVISAGYAVSGAKRAVSTLDWLAQHGYERLAQEAIVVLTDKDDVSSRVQKDMVRTHLASHSRQVFVVPNDPTVADGDRIDLERVHQRTREAWAEVAAAIIDGYR
jgi:hypothetical protein